MGSLKDLFDKSDGDARRRKVIERNMKALEKNRKARMNTAHKQMVQQLDDRIAELEALESAAFSLYQHAFPDYIPTKHQLGSVGYLLKKYGEEKLLEVFVYAAAREDMDPAGVHKYVWACLKRGF